jgi:succinate dehydrogenase / fumarate reductase cytochrome b subunit
MVNSLIISKILVAITGLMMVGFILGHTAANVLVFLGPDLGRDLLNTYAAGLKDAPLLLWGARGGLIVALIVHVLMTIKLVMLNKASKPINYKVKNHHRANFASQGMMIFGLVILFFLIYHLMHYTFGVTHPEFMDYTDLKGRHDVYKMVVAGFQQPIISIFYVVAVIGLGFHLKHGVQSMIHTLGISSNNIMANTKKVSNILSIAITLLLAFIPISILLGLVK